VELLGRICSGGGRARSRQAPAKKPPRRPRATGGVHFSEKLARIEHPRIVGQSSRLACSRAHCEKARGCLPGQKFVGGRSAQGRSSRIGTSTCFCAGRPNCRRRMVFGQRTSNQRFEIGAQNAIAAHSQRRQNQTERQALVQPVSNQVRGAKTRGGKKLPAERHIAGRSRAGRPR